jgi:ABC-type lipoprotein release transport system permease subunit
MTVRTFLAVAATGVRAVRHHPARSFACTAALVGVLVPYLVGESVALGLEAEAESPALFGATLSVSGEQFGHPVPIPLRQIEPLGKIEGVRAVAPRIIGTITLGKDQVPAVLVGLPPAHLGTLSAHIDGEGPRPGPVHELVVGAALARRLNLKVGSVLPPFYRNDHQGERLSRVVGVFSPSAPVWQSNLILTTFDTAAAVFDQEGVASDLLVWCTPEGATRVAGAVRTSAGRYHVAAREELFPAPPDARRAGGALTLLYLPVLACGALVLTVTSGAGLPERRREVAILRATGWQTDEILLRAAAESWTLCLIAVGAALVGVWVWLDVFNGFGVAVIFLPGPDPGVRVPYRLAPLSALVALVVALALVLVGTFFESWRAAVAEPREAMR